MQGAAVRELLRDAHDPTDRKGEPSPASDPAELPAELDPLALVLAAPVGQRSAPRVELTPGADFAHAVEELVRRIAWGGDRCSGTARIEFGSGRYRGGIIIVRADGRDLSVELELPGGADGAELGERLRTRFEQKGLSLTSLRIR